MRPWTRREFLKTAAAGALVGTGSLGCASSIASEGALRFPHGVASGDPLTDRVILWTRVSAPAGAAVGVEWVVARDVALRDVVARGQASADAARDYTVKVDASGLEPGRTWYYGFRAGGAASPVGRTRTLPAETDRVRLASCSCANYPHGFYNVYAAIARRTDLDAVVHLGDYIYEYGRDGYGASAIGRDVEPPHEITTLADYRTRYAHYRLDPELQALHAAHPMIAVWDDHEIANNAWREGAENHDPASEGSFAERRRAAVRAWSEWMPVRVAADFESAPRTWRSFRFGTLADLSMLDTRLAGRDLQAARTDRAAIEAPERTLLGAEQEAWLFERLDAAQRDAVAWRIVGQQLVFAPWARPPRPPNPDGWDGYPAARARVLDHLERARISDVVILSGDVHSSWALEVPRDPFGAGGYDPATSRGSLAVELVAPAVASSPLASFPNARERFGASLAELPHLRFFDLDQRGYVVVDLDRERMRAEWWFADTVAERATGETLARAFVVRRGTNRLEAL